MKKTSLNLLRAISTLLLAVGLVSAGAVSANAASHPAAVHGASAVHPANAGDGSPAGAVQWFAARNGWTNYHGLCEMAVENAYGTTGVWASANAHWNGAVQYGKAHPGDWSPPLGAFVYWNISAPYGHVGVSDGQGGFWATDVAGSAIGHAHGYGYFAGYRGWSNAQVPR